MDNLLSEMLLTVEALPDLSYSNNGGAATTASKNKQITDDVYTRQQQQQQQQRITNAFERARTTSPTPVSNSNNINTNEVKRSYVQQQAQALLASTNNNTNARAAAYTDNFGYSKNNIDIGETSSITTTLTPSESVDNISEHQFKGYYNNNDELFYDTDTQMQLHGRQATARHQHNEALRKEYLKRSENLLQNQSFSYMEVLRSENNISGRGQMSGSGGRYDESNMPYHAREYSKPFSYLPSTADAKIIKMHSGLSSPSMVRKALNLNGTSGRKTPSHEFSERAKYGRQQYEVRDTSKYTFGDKTPENNNLSVFDNDKLFDYRNRSENVKYKDSSATQYSVENSDVESSSAHYFEPLKRSNTMDGSFGRSGYASDG